MGLGYASDAIQTNFFGGEKIPMTISGVQCHGDENNLIDCLHDELLDCPGNKNAAETNLDFLVPFVSLKRE